MPTISSSTSLGKIYSVEGWNGSRSVTLTTIGSRTFSKTWVTTPDFRKKRRKFQLPMNPYSMVKTQTWAGRGSFESWNLGYPPWYLPYLNSGIVSGAYSVGVPVLDALSPTEMSTLTARVTTGLLLKLKNQDVNLAQAYAERRMTADLISTNIMRMVKAFRSLKSGNLKAALGALDAGPPSRRRQRRINGILLDKFGNVPSGRSSKRVFDDAAAVWLEIQYGWRPLIQDIYGSAKAIAAAASSVAMKTRVASKAEFNRVTRWQDPVLSSDKVTKKYSTVLHVERRLVVWYGSDDTPRTLTELGFTNPALLAWELTPFSFVVDWFLPVGNYLNSLDATSGLNFVKGSSSTLIQSSSRAQNDGRTDSVGTVTTGQAVGFSQRVEYGRSALASFPTPFFPGFKNPLSFEHASNAIALLVQVFSGSFKAH